MVRTDPDTGEPHVVATRRINLTLVANQGRKTKTVNLAGDVKPADTDKMAAVWAELYPGLHLNGWDPHLGRAELAALSEAAVRYSGAIAAAMGVNRGSSACRPPPTAPSPCHSPAPIGRRGTKAKWRTWPATWWAGTAGTSKSTRER